MNASVAIMVLSIAVAGVEGLRFLPSETSYADGGVMGVPHHSHDSPAASRDPRRGGMMNVAQGGRDARGRDDGATARSDALMGTPNKKTPVPQDNLFSTSPRLEQQPPASGPPGPAPRGATPAPPAAPR
jgi:hypothetical protein